MTGDLIYDQALIGDGKTTSCLIGDYLTMLIGDQADWSLIGGGKTGPKMVWNAEHKDDTDWVKHCMTLEAEGTMTEGTPKKIWWDYVTDVPSGCIFRNKWRIKVETG